MNRLKTLGLLSSLTATALLAWGHVTYGEGSKVENALEIKAKEGRKYTFEGKVF